MEKWKKGGLFACFSKEKEKGKEKDNTAHLQNRLQNGVPYGGGILSLLPGSVPSEICPLWCGAVLLFFLFSEDYGAAHAIRETTNRVFPVSAWALSKLAHSLLEKFAKSNICHFNITLWVAQFRIGRVELLISPLEQANVGIVELWIHFSVHDAILAAEITI